MWFILLTVLAVRGKQHCNISVPFTLQLQLFRLLLISCLLTFIDTFFSYSFSIPSTITIPIPRVRTTAPDSPRSTYVKRHSLPPRKPRQRADVMRNSDVKPSGPPIRAWNLMCGYLRGIFSFVGVEGQQQRVSKAGLRGPQLHQSKVTWFPERRAGSRGPNPTRLPPSPGERHCALAGPGWGRACAVRSVCLDPK